MARNNESVKFSSEEKIPEGTRKWCIICSKKIKPKTTALFITQLLREDGSNPQSGDDIRDLKMKKGWEHVGCAKKQEAKRI